MFEFLKRVFVSAMMFFGCSLSSVNLLKCVSMKNKKCNVRPEIVNGNSNEPVFFSFSIKQVNVLVVVTILMIPMQNCLFLMQLKF